MRAGTCKTSPHFGTVSRFANTEELIGPVTSEQEGEIYVFDFYDPNDEALYKIFDADDFQKLGGTQEYHRYTDHPGDVWLIVDVDKCGCEITKCRCCGRPLVVTPWHPINFSLDADCTWVLAKGELCDFERLNYDGYEVWHGINPANYLRAYGTK